LIIKVPFVDVIQVEVFIQVTVIMFEVYIVHNSAEFKLLNTKLSGTLSIITGSSKAKSENLFVKNEHIQLETLQSDK
jgi:hypothetical protein